MEPGETIEAAACREVYEEAGVRVQYASIRYQLSQPWPFPNSLMLGMIGQVLPTAGVRVVPAP